VTSTVNALDDSFLQPPKNRPAADTKKNRHFIRPETLFLGYGHLVGPLKYPGSVG